MRTLIVTPTGSKNLEIEFAIAAMIDSIERGEAPVSTTLIRYLQPNDPVRTGVAISKWGLVADQMVVYVDAGLDPQMRLEIASASLWDIPVVRRKLPTLASDFTAEMLARATSRTLELRG